MNVTFSAVINKERRCASCIQSVNLNNIAMVYAFSSEMPEDGRKNICRHKETTKKIMLMFLRLKCLRKSSNCVFKRFQETKNLECTFENLEKSSKIGQP